MIGVIGRAAESGTPTGEVERNAALYACRLRHVRHVPLRNDFTYRTYLWLVDLDAVPRLPRLLRPFADFRAADHFDASASAGAGAGAGAGVGSGVGAGTGTGTGSGRGAAIGPKEGAPASQPSDGEALRAGVEDYLAGQGIDLGGGRILMLANARVFGYVFNPLSVFWCHDASGVLRCVIAEVHNTYGQRHCYLLRTDESGRAAADKAFYVSPFNTADEGSYHMALPEPGEKLAVTIRLDLPGGRPPFVASLHGRRRPATAANVLLFGLRYPLATLVVSARIRVQGVKLYVRGLKVQPRPAPSPANPPLGRKDRDVLARARQ